jgi:Ubiquitin carboxyl-terminal hydrolase
MYELKGVLVHAGIAQGGHYYSFIKERPNDSNNNSNTATSSSDSTATATATATDAAAASDSSTSGSSNATTSDKWYRFDDEDVTLFDPGNGL